ncbi:hypothetical protein RQY89_004558 [Vibrio alginolyticus]|nr:hypothetical protein [Vibrio alginolyticus]
MDTTLDISTRITVICHRKQIPTIESMLRTIHGHGLVRVDYSHVTDTPFVRMEFSVSEHFRLQTEINPLDPVEETQKTTACLMASSYRTGTKKDHQQAVQSITLAQSVKNKLIAWLSKD